MTIKKLIKRILKSMNLGLNNVYGNFGRNYRFTGNLGSTGITEVGSSSAFLSDIVIEALYIETSEILRNKGKLHLLDYYGSYRDDGFFMGNGVEAFESFKQALLERNVRLFNKTPFRFTFEGPKRTVNFLDLSITLIDGNAPSFRVYAKEINQIKYLNKSSCHHNTHKRGIAESVRKRLERLTTNVHNEELENMYPRHDAALKLAEFKGVDNENFFLTDFKSHR